jgi:sugar phosphate permease
MSDPSRDRTTVATLLVLLFAITYLDRVCISVAGPRMQADLGIDPVGWGWVTGMFTLAYCVFEIPTGLMGDRLGPRRVLTRIVAWWSAFTALTGTVTGLYPLLAVRFLFGAGEAGAFPNASIVVARWFTAAQRATMSGLNLSAAQLGGALAPVIVLPLQVRFGWRIPFFVLGAVGVVWAVVWYAWFRDSPAEKSGADAGHSTAAVGHASGYPWRAAFASTTVRALLLIAFSYIYVYTFFQTWFHTFLVKGRGVSEAGLILSVLPYVIAIPANIVGGWASDALAARFGPRKGRRMIGAVSLSVAALLVVLTMATRHPVLTVVLLAFAYGAITFQQSGVFGVCLDIGGPHAGAMIGVMNTSAQVGAFIGSVAYGYLVAWFGSYDAPFVPMAVILGIGALMWLRIDASQPLSVRRAEL